MRSSEAASQPVARTSLMESLEGRLCFSDTTSTGVSLADVDGDGKRDLITTRSGHNGGLSVRFGNDDGTFGAPHYIAGYTFARGSTCDIADFNGDGHIDIVVYGGINGYNGGGSGGMYVLLNNGDGTFAAPERIGGTAFAGLASGSLNDVKLAVGIAVGQTDVDIIVTDPHLAFRGRHKAYRPETYLLTGNGDGTFNDATPIT